MKHILTHMALSALMAISSGCTQQEQTKTVDGYTVSAPPGATFVPTSITYDGNATSIQLKMPYRGTPPVLFQMAGHGGVDTARYRWDGSQSRFVVDGRIKHAVLAVEDKRVTITHD